jgi:hypothetical protein
MEDGRALEGGLRWRPGAEAGTTHWRGSSRGLCSSHVLEQRGCNPSRGGTVARWRRATEGAQPRAGEGTMATVLLLWYR